MEKEILKYKKEIEKMIKTTTKLLGQQRNAPNDFDTRIQNIHRERDEGLPKGYMGIYTFIYLGFEEGGRFLKVGQAGVNSNDRFVRQHYNNEKKESESRLSTYIIKDKDFPVRLNEDNIKSWMRDNLYRIDILIKAENDKRKDKITLNFIEGLIQYKYKPRYEGDQTKKRKLKHNKSI